MHSFCEEYQLFIQKPYNGSYNSVLLSIMHFRCIVFNKVKINNKMYLALFLHVKKSVVMGNGHVPHIIKHYRS